MKKIKPKYVHVNQLMIRANKTKGENNPVVTVKWGTKNTYGHTVSIDGPSEVVYSGAEKPILPCGARVVIMTYAKVIVTNTVTNEEIILE